MTDNPTGTTEPYYKDGEYGFHDHPESEADSLRRQLDECHRQHESVIKRLDDALAMAEIWRVRCEAHRQAAAARAKNGGK